MNSDLLDSYSRKAGGKLESWMTNPPRPAMWHMSPEQRDTFAKLVEQDERARCIEAIRTTLANWRCVPSQSTREFAELCIREIEK